MSSTPIKVTNAVDTFVKSNGPSMTFAGADLLELSSKTGYLRYAYLFFARPFPKGVTILSAKLRLVQRNNESGSWTVHLRKVNGPWTASKTTWSNKPPAVSADTKTLTKSGTAAYTVWEFDVTSHMQAVADGATWYGWRLETTDTANFRRFWSAQGSVSGRQVKPTLEVVYVEKPSQPTQLAPAGGRVTSLAKPTLRFDYTDAQGSTTMQGFQVQMNATNSFTSPSFDTGTVLASVPQLDLNDTAFAGLSDGQTIYWRVRVQDNSGLWSPWSDATSFTRRVKPTLTLLNPPANEIDEPTPPINWSLTGGTQTAFQVIVKDTSGNWLHSSGKTTSSVTDYTIPAGVIKTNNASYVLELRVWDEYNRESSPGDATYMAAVRTVSYHYDSTTDPVTNLQAEVLYPRPAVRLTWNRDLAPDSFVIRRDDEIIKPVLEGPDAQVSGTSYQYYDFGASPGKAHVYKVDAVVNGKTSAGSPSVTVTPKSVGIWLMDPSEHIYVQILGVDEGTWDMGEEAGVYAPIGASKSVRVTQALRGYEGSITGVISETPDSLKPINEQEEDIWKLKSRPGKTYTLTLSDKSMKVVIGNVVVAPTPTRDLVKKVSFDFWAQEVPFEAEL